MVQEVKGMRVEHLEGGDGAAMLYSIVPEEDLLGKGRLYAKVVLEPKSSVGRHTHIGETEPYYILEGTGVFEDNDGTRTEVHPGDVCTIKPGEGHAIYNESETDTLTFIALIYFD